MKSPSPNPGSMDFEMGMSSLLFTDPLDDLSMLVAASTSSTGLQGKANVDVHESAPLEWFSQERRSSQNDFAEALLDYGGTISKRAKSSSWNISFGHAHSCAELIPSACDRSRKRPSADKQRQQCLADEGIISASVKTEFDQNAESYPTHLHVSKLESLRAPARKENSLSSATSGSSKKCPISSPPRNLEEEHAYTLSKNGAHIMAERKRREKLNQKFIALSAVVPGLKKADKASILADAVSYVKQLEEQLKVLEDQQVPKAVSSPALKNSDERHERDFQKPDIEARMVGKSVLIRVHCGKTESVLVKALEELENLKLSVINANVLTFSNAAIDLTFTAQIEEDCKLTADDMVEALHVFFRGLK